MKKRDGLILLAFAVCLTLGFVAAWVFKPTRAGDLKTCETNRDKEKKACDKNKEDLGKCESNSAIYEKAHEDCEDEFATTKTNLKTRDDELATCNTDLDAHKEALAKAGEDASLLYKSIGKTEEEFCPIRGGIFRGGKCQCDGEWSEGICVNLAELEREKICVDTGGEWDADAAKCDCGKTMRFSKTGCTKWRPQTAAEEIAVLKKRIKKLGDLETRLSKCRKALATPPKVTIKGAKVVKCKPASACQ